jgi:hypothetical protein
MEEISLKKLADLKNQYDTMIRDHGEKMIRDYITEWMNSHPEVKAIGWEQYAPYFNDGEPCEFDVHEIFKATDSPDIEDIEYMRAKDEKEYFLRSSYREMDCWKNNNMSSKTGEDFRDFALTMYELSDLLESAFGNGSRIIVTQDEISVTECHDHD